MPFECTDCALHPTKGNHYVAGRGNLKAEVVFIMSHPSTRDAACGIPLVRTDEMEMMNRLLAEIGLKREKVFVTNLVRCAPPIDKDKETQLPPEDSHIEACHKYLEKELAFIKPKVIVVMGGLTAKRFLGARSLGSVEGRVFDSKDAVGLSYALSGDKKEVTRKGEKKTILFNQPNLFKVIPTYSPAFVLRDPRYAPNIKRAFQLVKDVLDGKDTSAQTYDYKYAHTEQEAFSLLTEIYQRCKTEEKLVFDIETSGLNWYKRMFSEHVSTMISCGFSFQERQAYCVSFRPAARSERNLRLFRQIMESPIKKGGHNGKFDNVFIRGELGIQVNNFVGDTMLMAHLLNQGEKVGLGVLSPIYRPDLGYYWEAVEKKIDDLTGYLTCPDDLLFPYNCKDVDATMTLWNTLEPLLVERGLDRTFNEITMPHAREAENMEFHGIQIDVDKSVELGKTLLKQLAEAEKAACAAVDCYPHWADEVEGKSPLNLGSPKQLAEVLFGKLKMKVQAKSEKTGAPSVNETTLEALKHEHKFPELVLEYRTLTKQLNTYIGWEAKEDGTEGAKTDGSSLLALVDVNGRIHTNLLIHGTATGRASCSSPNLQNIPKSKRFRDLFTSKPGYVLVDSDFAALELRILALLSQDEAMLQIFRDKVDPHTATAAKMFGKEIKDIDKNGKERKTGKAINFGIVYGEGAKKLGNSLGISRDEAQRYLDDWSRAYPQITNWIRAQHQFVRKNGFVKYSLGRERPLPGIFSDDTGLQAEAERQAVNSQVQGVGADCTSISVVRIGERLRKELGDEKAHIVIEIHDAIVVEVEESLAKKAEAIIIEEMTRQMPMLSSAIPLEVDCEIKKTLGDGLSE